MKCMIRLFATVGVIHASCLLAISAPLHVSILNAAAVKPGILEEIRVHAEKELCVPVSATDIPAIKESYLKSMGKIAAKNKLAQDACLVVLVLSESSLHSCILTNEQVAVINVSALRSDDETKFVRRLQRWAIRGPAFLFGVEPDIDPFCVMHDYQTLDQLDQIGMNFSPPWGDKFRQAAKARGLELRQMSQRPKLKINMAPAVAPVSTPQKAVK